MVLDASAFNLVGAHEETFPSFLVLKKGPIGTTHAYKKDHCYQESMKTMHALSSSPLVIVIADLRRDMGDSMSKVPGSNIVAIKRWTCFVAAIWLQSINGTNFDFSDYSSALKKTMGINQLQLNSLAVASDLGKIMGWVSGLACVFLPTWAVLGIAMSLGMVGYGVQWLILSKTIHPLDYWQVYILCLLAGNSICWFNTVSFRAAIENFPSKRGIASGLSTSYVGLSTIIYTCLSSILAPGNPSLYLLLNCIVPAVVGIISAVLLYVSQSKKAAIEEDADKKYMILCTLIAISTAVYSIIFEFLPHGKRQLEGIYMAVLIILLMAPLYIPIKIAFNNISNERRVNSCCASPLTVENTQEISRGVSPSNNHRCQVEFIQSEETKSNTQSLEIQNPRQNMQNFNHVEDTRFQPMAVSSLPYPVLGEEHSILQLLRSIDFWLYYFVYFCGGTVGLVFINNLGQIVQSFGYSKTPILVSLVSSFGFFGRIASGLPDYIQQCSVFKNYRPLPRTGWMGIWMAPMVVAFLLLGLMNSTSKGVLCVSTAIVGTSVGAITSLAIPISSEMFGMKRFGVNHNILITNIAFGSILFGEVAGVLYDDTTSGVDKQRTNLSRNVCMGKQCFRKTFLLWGCVCLFGLALCFILSVRTRELYDSIHKKTIP